MRHRLIGFGTGLVEDPQLITFHDERIAAALVVEIQHPGIDFDDAATKALQYLARGRRRMPDHDPIRADCVKRCLQSVPFDDLAASNVAAVPKRALRMQYRCVAEFSHGSHGVEHLLRGVERWHVFLDNFFMIVERVGGEHYLRFRQGLRGR